MNLAKLPPAARDLNRLPLFAVRNKRGQLAGDKALKHLSASRLALAQKPQELVAELLRLENVIGTRDAALAGFLAVTGSGDQEMVEGVELFHRLNARLPQVSPAPTSTDLKTLYAFLEPKLAFEAYQNHFFQALKGLEHNFNSAGSGNTGNCLVYPALFSLFALSAGGLAGEGHDVKYMHSYGYLPCSDGQTYYIDVDVWDHHFSQKPHGVDSLDSFAISSIFSFASIFLTYNVFHKLENVAAGETLPRAVLRKMLRQLELAEAINPYYRLIYRTKAKIYEKLYEFARKLENDEYADALLELRFAKGFPQLS